jgi:hypothetical protein
MMKIDFLLIQTLLRIFVKPLVQGLAKRKFVFASTFSFRDSSLDQNICKWLTTPLLQSPTEIIHLTRVTWSVLPEVLSLTHNRHNAFCSSGNPS